MKFLYGLGGANIPVIKEFEIDKNLNVEAGMIMRRSSDGKIFPGAVGECIGVVAEDHSGEKDILNARNDGTKLRIDITQGAVYSVPAPRVTAKSGSTTTLVCDASDLASNLGNSVIVLVKKGENSENTDSIGSERNVNSSSVSGSSCTLTIESGAKICEGDEYAVFPQFGYKGAVALDNKGFTFNNPEITTNLKVISHNKKLLTLEVLLDKML